jgi:replicative DNA helicase
MNRASLASMFRRVDGRMLEDLRDSQAGSPEYVATPWPTLNAACRGEGGGLGFGLGWYVLLAGLTGAGKTLAALNLVDAALRRGVDVLFVSLEMSAGQLLTRLRAIASGEDILGIEWGSRFDVDRAAAADRILLERPGQLFVNTSPIHELADIREVLRVHVEDYGVRLVVVDYAQLVSPAGRDADLFARMAEISAQLRFEAQRHRVVCLALSQLNRRERQGEIGLDSLFGSSRFGFDADLVLGLSYETDRDPIRRAGRTKLLVLKNRHGPAPEIPVEVDYASFRIREIEP